MCNEGTEKVETPWMAAYLTMSLTLILVTRGLFGRAAIVFYARSQLLVALVAYDATAPILIDVHAVKMLALILFHTALVAHVVLSPSSPSLSMYYVRISLRYQYPLGTRYFLLVCVHFLRTPSNTGTLLPGFAQHACIHLFQRIVNYRVPFLTLSTLPFI